MKKECVVINGNMFSLPNMEAIPVAHMGYQTVPEDGHYSMIEATCDKTCEVGYPAQSCIDRKIVSKNKCAVYYFTKIEPALPIPTTRPIAEIQARLDKRVATAKKIRGYIKNPPEYADIEDLYEELDMVNHDVKLLKWVMGENK